jgi:hypothetical protein
VRNQAENLTGTFKLADGRTVFGSLRVCGKESKITLFDDIEFFQFPEYYAYLTGDLHDGRLVTLFDCTLERTERRSTSADRMKYSAQLFPHFVAIGHQHIPSSEPCIAQVSFAMKDASSVFYDFDAFSTVLDPEPFVPLLVNDKAKIRPVEIGDDPIIGYFTGKFDIAVVETPLGEIKAHHQINQTLGGPRGIRIDNKVMVTLTVARPLTFEESLNRLSVLLRFFELIIGCEQPLTDLNVRLFGQDETSSSIKIYRSFGPDSHKAVDPEKRQSPGPRDVLVTIVESSEQYATVLKNYLASDGDRHDSRARLRSALNIGRRYTIDRAIAAANLFDIFPKSAYPAKENLSKELEDAKAEARKLFKALPDSFERSTILGAIGRIGELSLKHKVRHRVTSTGLDKHFPQLMDVLEEAVNCRNHYVHGSPGKIDYSANFPVVCFFTDALEFAFGASDLIDSGWDFLNWTKGLPQFEHPFGAFRLSYKERLENFNKLMQQSKLHKED